MTEIRPQDKLFLAVVIPLAAAALYVWGWRADAARRLQALEARQRELVTSVEFPTALARARAAQAAAEKELAAARAQPPPVTRVKAPAAELPPARARRVLDVLRHAGLAVVDDVPGENAVAAARLQATGVCPDPTVRVFTLEGGYPAITRALETFDAREAAVLPVSLEMAGNGARARWKLTVAF